MIFAAALIKYNEDGRIAERLRKSMFRMQVKAAKEAQIGQTHMLVQFVPKG